MTFRVLCLLTLTLTFLTFNAAAQCPTAPPDPLVILENGKEAKTPPVGVKRIAQTFVVPGAGCTQVQSIQFQVLGDSPLGDLVVAIYSVDSTGKPAAAIGASASIPLFDSVGAYVSKTAIFATPVQVTGGGTYAVVFSEPSATKGSEHYTLRTIQNPAGGPYPYGVVLIGSGAAWEAQPTRDVLMTVAFGCCPTGCVYSHGYWKNHPTFWPVTTVTLGSVAYTQQQGLQILDQPVGGNGLISLAHQLIGAKLNILAGAPAAPISSTISAADALIGGLTVPPVGSGSLHPSATGSLNETLTHYNEGLLPGAPHCR